MLRVGTGSAIYVAVVNMSWNRDVVDQCDTYLEGL
jgi:hypothetical protein